MTKKTASPGPFDNVATSPDRRPIVEHIAEHIGDDIVRGLYKPSEHVRVNDLAERFGVSAGPAREALIQVASEGLIEISSYRGARVVKLSKEQIHDHLVLTQHIFALIASALAERCSKTERHDIAAMIKDFVTLVKSDASPPQIVEESYDVYARIGVASRNTIAAQLLRKSARWPQAFIFTQEAIRKPAHRREAARVWNALARALAKGDADAARQTALEVTGRSNREMLAYLETLNVDTA